MSRSFLSFPPRERGGRKQLFPSLFFLSNPREPPENVVGGKKGEGRGDTKQKLTSLSPLWLSFEKRFWEAKSLLRSLVQVAGTRAEILFSLYFFSPGVKKICGKLHSTQQRRERQKQKPFYSPLPPAGPAIRAISTLGSPQHGMEILYSSARK